MNLIILVLLLQQNHLYALICQIYFWNRSLHVSDSSSTHHQQSSTVHAEMHTGYANCLLLASCQHNLYDIYRCCVYSEKLLMLDRGTVRNM